MGEDVVGVSAAKVVDQSVVVANVSVIDGPPRSGGDAIDLAWVACVRAWLLAPWSGDVSAKNCQWDDWSVVDGVANSGGAGFLGSEPTSCSLLSKLQLPFGSRAVCALVEIGMFDKSGYS